MKTQHDSSSRRRAFTLLEMTIVIMVLLGLIQMGFFASTKMDEWKRGREASETLREVWTAQRMFLADNPTAVVADIVEANVLPYMRGAPAALPTIKPMKGANLTILVNVSPPRITGAYDPSDSTTDSLWDVGE